jgi:hypothetical protein
MVEGHGQYHSTRSGILTLFVLSDGKDMWTIHCDIQYSKWILTSVVVSDGAEDMSEDEEEDRGDDDEDLEISD